jgi:hypothetical protein
MSGYVPHYDRRLSRERISYSRVQTILKAAYSAAVRGTCDEVVLEL